MKRIINFLTLLILGHITSIQVSAQHVFTGPQVNLVANNSTSVIKNVSTSSGTLDIDNIDVKLSIETGGNPIDLSAIDIGLESPDGTFIQLVLHGCQGTTSLVYLWDFKDDAANYVDQSCATTGDVKPAFENPAGIPLLTALSDFDGEDAVGDWTLSVFNFDVGAGSEPIQVNWQLIIDEVCTDTYTDWNVTACNSYTVPSGDETYTTSGVYSDTLPMASGCDSIFTIDLTVEQVDITTTVNGGTIIANASGATYQWVDCDNNMAPIMGAVNQSFTPPGDGNYAVQIGQNGCTVTSECVAIGQAGVNENEWSAFKLYPNPTNGIVNLDFGQEQKNVMVQLLSLSGTVIQEERFYDTDVVELTVEQPGGIYLVKITGANDNAITRRLTLK